MQWSRRQTFAAAVGVPLLLAAVMRLGDVASAGSVLCQVYVPLMGGSCVAILGWYAAPFVAVCVAVGAGGILAIRRGSAAGALACAAMGMMLLAYRAVFGLLRVRLAFGWVWLTPDATARLLWGIAIAGCVLFARVTIGSPRIRVGIVAIGVVAMVLLGLAVVDAVFQAVALDRESAEGGEGRAIAAMEQGAVQAAELQIVGGLVLIICGAFVPSAKSRLPRTRLRR